MHLPITIIETIAVIILGMSSANEKTRYYAKPPLIGQSDTKNDACLGLSRWLISNHSKNCQNCVKDVNYHCFISIKIYRIFHFQSHMALRFQSFIGSLKTGIIVLKFDAESIRWRPTRSAAYALSLWHKHQRSRVSKQFSRASLIFPGIRKTSGYCRIDNFSWWDAKHVCDDQIKFHWSLFPSLQLIIKSLV